MLQVIIWRLQILGAFGVFGLLFGVAILASTQSVFIRPFSWTLYWRLTQFQWIVGSVCTLAGFAIWRLVVKEIRKERSKEQSGKDHS